ncbi:MAG: hypothetical protein D3923_08070 [Candidatus Electrothrix sp. AR3]|nr:hypothetical protein [Candidatus Electrothrix sp. AR3]
MSHQIDFKSHGTARDWNGHWMYSNFLWKVIRGKRTYLLNREPYSSHKRLLEQAGFFIVKEKKIHMASSVRLQDLDAKFSSLSEEDLQTSGVYIIAAKDGSSEIK